jgi:hypothetical protein
MRASDLAGIASGCVFFGAGLLAQYVHDPLAGKLLYFTAVGAIVWYAWKGHNLEGWIGPSYREMLKEIRRLEALSANWRYPNGSEVPFDKRGAILVDHQRLIEKIRFHPDNPRSTC